MRHVCQDSDELSTYGWTHHSVRDYGHQVLIDQGMTLATSFLKSNEDGSGYGGDWTVRIDVKIEKMIWKSIILVSKTPHIHNLSDLVQESLGDQICKKVWSSAASRRI